VSAEIARPSICHLHPRMKMGGGMCRSVASLAVWVSSGPAVASMVDIYSYVRPTHMALFHYAGVQCHHYVHYVGNG
jgi:hypothetical protein